MTHDVVVACVDFPVDFLARAIGLRRGGGRGGLCARAARSIAGRDLAVDDLLGREPGCLSGGNAVSGAKTTSP
jgi:hypothetical protein